MAEPTTLTTTEQVPPSTTASSPSDTASEFSTTQSTGPTATVNHDILPAFPTIIPKQPGKNLCFRTINEDRRYGNFSEAAAGTLVGKLCADGDAFHPDDSEHVQSAPGTDGDLKVWIRWAEDQRGCSPKRAFPMGEPCAGTWLGFEVDCDISTTDPDGSYGGGFVSSSKFGCLEFGMVKDSKQWLYSLILILIYLLLTRWPVYILVMILMRCYFSASLTKWSIQSDCRPQVPPITLG
ncbi:hypothetical protein ASPVEDRAFT_309828 [Aspergillus versicolor CBS 583.65]|uniref:Uncharacterized protein n=1 Tax=Aspergillus versicolor CBS 583.65 TaxID=1036611 RepID=A0A1L9PWT4_ASPVE|nr:uncharacterized protein ASPVEDRAFT_309828 [Aspergillus versicolor CBS 583.65]OJJ05999.1 hypothetical protein ASPVEDRAFT_309828 [Aspergillus versicolor CBS 583.65]